MGMSASQARLLSITARINDVEYKSQQISNTKLRLADESEQVANDYTRALNKQKFTYQTFENGAMKMKDVDSSSVKLAGYTLESTKAGVEVPTSYTASDLYEMIESGLFRLVRNDKDGNATSEEVSVSSEKTLAIANDNSELAKAEADYNSATAKINRKEKLLDNDLKALDTEHSALTTEFDSVKTLIGDNVEKSFNLFS